MRARTVAVVVIVVLGVLAWYFRGAFLPQVSPPAPKSAETPQTASSKPAAPAGSEKPAPSAAQKLEKEAKAYVKDISRPEPEAIPADNANNFVHKNQVLSLIPKQAIKTMTPKQILASPNIKPSTPITIVKEQEEEQFTTPEKLAREAGGNLNAPVEVVEHNKVHKTTVGEVLKEHRQNPTKPITIMKKVQHLQVMTAGQLEKDKNLAPNKPIKVITQPYGLPSATVGELMMGAKGVTPDTIFYVRTVKKSDTQGIWGIVESGLIDNFARGIAIRRGENINTYQVDIPKNADELLANHSSSFLGRLIYEKTLDTYVYNYAHGHMGRNPDLIYPGQEVVIVKFSPDELVSIYKHFVQHSG